MIEAAHNAAAARFHRKVGRNDNLDSTHDREYFELYDTCR